MKQTGKHAQVSFHPTQGAESLMAPCLFGWDQCQCKQEKHLGAEGLKTLRGRSFSGLTMHGRVRVERPRNALELTHHALGRLGVRQHKVDGTHTLSIQTCEHPSSQLVLIFEGVY